MNEDVRKTVKEFKKHSKRRKSYIKQIKKPERFPSETSAASRRSTRHRFHIY